MGETFNRQEVRQQESDRSSPCDPDGPASAERSVDGNPDTERSGGDVFSVFFPVKDLL